MASIEHRKTNAGKISFRAKIRLKGFPVQSATFARLTDARKWAQITESAILEGRHFKTVEAKRHTFAELADRYISTILPRKPKTARDQLKQMHWWKDQIGARLLSDITPALVAEQRDNLLFEPMKNGKTRSPSTVVRYLAVLSHAFSVAVREWGWLDDSPMRKVTKPKEPRGRVRFLTDDERNRLIAACNSSDNKFLLPAVILALATGMRKSEIMNLTWDDVDFDRGRITLHQTKNGERRGVPLAGYARQLLSEHARVRRLDTNLLFPGQHRSQPMDLRASWVRALRDAQVNEFRFHDLRHCTASYLAMNGASLAEIAEVLGHKTLQMVQRYAHLSDAHTASVVSKMNDKIFGEQFASQ